MTGASLQRRVIRSGMALGVGRLAIAVIRLGIAAIIVRQLGAETFAEYMVILALLSLAEWVLDYGTVETLVRDMLREPARRSALLRVAAAAKFLQVPLAVALMAAALYALGYPTHIVRAGMIAAVSLVFLAGVAVLRAVFKAALTMEREIAAELASVAVMLPLVGAVAFYGGGLSGLMAAYGASRASFLLFAAWAARDSHRLSLAGAPASEVLSMLRSAAPIGTIGLLVAAYETIDLLMLSKFAGATDVAFYSASQRLVWPVLMALGAIGGTLYPVAASHWPQAPERFREVCQTAADSVIVLAGLALASFLAGAEFYLGLLGPALLPGAGALRVLGVLVFVKAITATFGPVLYVVHAQKYALAFISAAVVAKAAAAFYLAGHFGYLGVAVGAIAIEIICALMPTLYLLHSLADFKLDWKVPRRAAAFAAVAGWAAHLADPSGGMVAALLAPAGFALLALLTRTVPHGRLTALLPRAGR